MPPIIKTRNLTRIYRPDTVPVYALNGVDLDIEEGEFTAIVGPSGSGKTTLLNMIGGLDRPSSGEVIIDGTEIHDLSDSQLIDFRRTHIGFVFQAYNLIPVLTARENVEFVMLLQRWSREERHRRVLELMKAVGLEDKLDSRPAQLSGGQQQRVAVARALASRPRFVLADEPTANLDSQSSGKLLDMMARLNREEKMTFLFSTHDQRVIDRARRVVTLVDGKVDSDLVRDTLTPPS
ncbi:MAG: ABC transporter ATP-binding protein [Saprospiraceae bacterium]|jgi:putative ABC transport system ATP-binding protein